MTEIYRGHKVKSETEGAVKTFLTTGLASGETIQALFYANKVLPPIDTIVITNMRLFGVQSRLAHTISGYKLEIAGNDIQSAAAEAGKFTGNLFPLKIVAPNGKVVSVASVKKEEADTIVDFIIQTKGKPEPLAKSITTNAELARDTEIAQKAAIILAFDRSEQDRNEADRAILSTNAGKDYIKKADEELVSRREGTQTVPARNHKHKAGTCPRCGSDNLQAVQETKTKGVDGCCSGIGCLMLGPLGLLCGLPGAGRSSSSTQRMCLNCGKKFK